MRLGVDDTETVARDFNIVNVQFWVLALSQRGNLMENVQGEQLICRTKPNYPDR